MKKILAALAVLLVLDVALLFVHGGKDAAERPDGLRVGLVFDVGGRGDKSFNDSAYFGLRRAEQELGIHAEYIEPGEGADRESAIRIFASRGFDLIVGVGFIFTDDITLLANEYPDIRFACIDYALKVDEEGRTVPPPPNVAALEFREEEGSFLVGALAGLTSQSRKVGFVGGMDIPLIRRFQAGYAAGVAEVCPSCAVSVNYAGVTGAAFKDPGKGKALALAQYQAGVDVIFHASGSTGLGVFEAAREEQRRGREAFAIGVDSDQYHEAPCCVLSSMVKRVDTAVYLIIREVAEGRFAGGVHTFGLAEDGVGYVYDDNNRARIPDAVRSRVEAIRAQITSGAIHVPTRPR